MSGLENNSNSVNSSKIANIIRSPPISSKPLPPTPPTKQTAIESVVPPQQQQHHTSITRSNLISIANRERDPMKFIKNQNRHTIAISANEDYENVFSASNSNFKLDDVDLSSTKKSSTNVIQSEQKNSFDWSSSSPPLVNKATESVINNENYQGINEVAAINNSHSHLKTLNVEGNSNAGESGSSRSSSRNAMLTLASSMGTLGDSDHEMLESSATGLSGSGSNGGLEEEDESGEDDIDSGSHNASMSLESDDFTTKRLKTFVATTLHNERVYLEKLSKLTHFKSYLEENFNGSQADISILFSGVQQVYTIHDVVASKLQGYLNSLTDLLTNSNNSSYKSSPLMNQNRNQISSKLAAQLDTNQLNAPSSSNSLMKESFLSSALQLLASIMEISFPVYLEFLKNYSKAMTILNKLEEKPSNSSSSSSKTSSTKKTKTFIDCQIDFNRLLQKENLDKEKNGLASRFEKIHGQSGQFITSPTKDPYSIYYNDVKKSEEVFDLTKIFAEEILRRPAKLFEFIHSLKDECIMASNELPNNYSSVLQASIKSLFENESSKSLREKVFDEINRNIMPKEVRKHEDVIELIESNNERKIRHLILYGDCLVCCRIKK
jgi:hypothetical protein